MLITIRHGKTDFNERRVFSGRGDMPRLTKQAHVEAYNLGKELKKYNIDIAFVSPLIRTKETFEEINKTLDIPMIIDGNLIERDFKDYEGKDLSSLQPEIYWDMDKSNVYDIEPIDELVARVEKVLNLIKEKYPNKNVLIVSHSGVCRAIKYIVEGKKNRKWYEYEMKNLQAYIYKEW